jgi:hypothetical protein
MSGKNPGLPRECDRELVATSIGRMIGVVHAEVIRMHHGEQGAHDSSMKRGYARPPWRMATIAA